jgi:hypothetical protein
MTSSFTTHTTLHLVNVWPIDFGFRDDISSRLVGVDDNKFHKCKVLAFSFRSVVVNGGLNGGHLSLVRREGTKHVQWVQCHTSSVNSPKEQSDQQVKLYFLKMYTEVFDVPQFMIAWFYYLHGLLLLGFRVLHMVESCIFLTICFLFS